MTDQLAIDFPNLVTPTYRPEQTLAQRFWAFHNANPHVLAHLERMTADLAAAGVTRIGIGMLFEVLRYDAALRTGGDSYKLNNSYRSRYARLIVRRHPEWADLFEMRPLRTVTA